MKQANLFLASILLMIGVLLPGCSGSTSLIGEWELVSYGSASAPTPALPGVDTSISFNEDGQFGGTVGCNSFSAEYKVSGNQITFGSMVSTMMYCEATAEQESAVLGILSAAALTYKLGGDSLTITSADGSSVIVLARK